MPIGFILISENSVTSTIVWLILSSFKISCHVKPNSTQTFFYSLSPFIKLDELPQPVEIGFNKECWENSLRGRDPSFLSIKVFARVGGGEKKNVRKREKRAFDVHVQSLPTGSKCRRSRHAKPTPTVTGGWAIGTGGQESTNDGKNAKVSDHCDRNKFTRRTSQLAALDLARFPPQPQFLVKYSFGSRSEAARGKGGLN